MKKLLKTIIKVLILIFTFISGLITATVIWLTRDWSEMNATELLYHMGQSLDGANPEVTSHYLKTYFLVTVLIMVLAIAVAVLAHRKAKAKIVYALYIVGSLGLLAFAGYLLESKMGLISYAKYRIKIERGSADDFIGDHYVDPRDVELVFPEKKRNLIFIFLESVEMTYTDEVHGGAFPEDIIPELTELAKEGETFSSDKSFLEGGISLQGTKWTMGGMFAQSAGIPLQISIGGNGMEKQDNFFPNIITLGDILEDNGYKQELMIGSDAVFGGRDKYYKQHGNYSILDYNWALDESKIPEDYYVWWGYEDKKLFEFAREELVQLSEGEEPFNLTLLTVDTHFEDGYKCELCQNKYEGNQYANSYACSSRQVSEFVRWIQQQPFYENTTIILSGDHLTMDIDFCNNVDEEYQRKTYFNVINGNAERDNNRDRNYTTMDVFPTTLAALGVRIPGNRLGLGTNLYSNDETLLEMYDINTLEDYAGRPSAFLLNQSKVYISKDDLDEVKIAHFSYATLDNGNLVVSLSMIRSINIKSLKKAELVIKNRATGEEFSYSMKAVSDEIDPNIFAVISDTGVSEKDLDDIVIEIYFTVDEIENYKVFEWEKTEE